MPWDAVLAWLYRGFRFGGWDGLDEAENLLGVGDIGHALLAVGSGHFQTVTICNGFISFIRETLFQDTPINWGIRAIGQNGKDIDDGEYPFFLAGVPGAADLFFFEEGDGGHGLMVDVGVGKFSKGVFTGDFQEEMPWGDEAGEGILRVRLLPVGENG